MLSNALEALLKCPTFVVWRPQNRAKSAFQNLGFGLSAPDSRALARALLSARKFLFYLLYCISPDSDYSVKCKSCDKTRFNASGKPLAREVLWAALERNIDEGKSIYLRLYLTASEPKPEIPPPKLRRDSVCHSNFLCNLQTWRHQQNLFTISLSVDNSSGA